MSKKNGRRQERTPDTSRKNRGIWDEIEGKCNGKRLGGDGLCRQPEGWGVIGITTGRCKRHGGATKNHLIAAKRELLDRAIVTYGLPHEIDPTDALLDEVHRTAGWVRYLHGEVEKIPEGELHKAVHTALLSKYDRERRHGLDVYRTAIGAGIEERRVRVAEQTGALIAQVINGVLEDLGIADRPEVPGIVRKHLMAIEGGNAA